MHPRAAVPVSATPSAQGRHAGITFSPPDGNDGGRARLAPRLAAVALLGAASVGCVTTSGGPGGDAFAQAPAARGELRTLGPLRDPTAAALEARALQDINRMLADGDALFDPGLGTACPVSYPLEQVNKVMRAQGLSDVAPPLAYTLTMISGACPEQGAEGDFLFNGPVEYVLYKHDRHEFIAGEYSDSIWTTRAAGVYVQGKETGEYTELRRLLSKQYRRLASGEVIEKKSPGHDFNKPIYQADYRSLGSAGALNRPTVVFSSMDWLARDPKVSVTVNEQASPERVVSTNYENGKLSTRTRMKTGRLHGWTEYFDPDFIRVMGYSRQCYQNGQLVKATECPD